MLKSTFTAFALALVTLTLSPAAARAQESSEWIRPKTDQAPLVWGRRDGIVFGIPSQGGMGGPNGLIRVGALSTTGVPTIVNFIAIEPVTAGPGPRHTRMAFSELERSIANLGRQGKKLWTNNPTGTLATGSSESLTVRIEVEPFTANNAHVYLDATMYANRPEELHLTVNHHKTSATIEELTLSATMGNKERLRQLWLKDEIVDSRQLYAGYKGIDFIESAEYPFSRMHFTAEGPIAIATTDEYDPSEVFVKERPHWTYTLPKLTQYWRVPANQVELNLRTRVNGRRVYWKSQTPIPGGISFENFEVRQAYKPGQTFIFGMTPKAPGELIK